MSLILIASAKPAPALPLSLIEVAQQFGHVREGLLQLDRLEREALATERELEAFLESYYETILPLSIRLERLRYRKQYGVFPSRPIAIEIVTLPHEHRASHLLRDVKKSLFRRLVKRCHPDSPTGSVVNIMQVYEAKNISDLWLLDIRHNNEMLEGEDFSQYLEAEREAITRTTLMAEHRLRMLSYSEGFELMERVTQASLDGINLIEAIQHRIENQIAALQQYFVKPREFRLAS